MEPITFKTLDYKNRAELDANILASVGSDPEINRTRGHIISGSAEDLKRLHLSLTTTVYGVPCVEA